MNGLGHFVMGYICAFLTIYLICVVYDFYKEFKKKKTNDYDTRR
jgi:hypothetical protein